MIQFQRTTTGQPACLLATYAQRRVVGVAALPKSQPERHSVPVLSRIGQCAGAVALATMLVRLKPLCDNTRWCHL